ncbi:MAG: DUF4956 domain-containing protein [Gemmatimonadaceae bacterium]|nr:DUF4956 domain-containing protein [Gemmatimonadaceae bacterium]
MTDTKPNKTWLAFWENLPLRLTAYYAVLLGLGSAIIAMLPRDSTGRLTGAVGRLMGGSAGGDNTFSVAGGSAKTLLTAAAGHSPADVVLSTTIAVLAAVALTTPVAWTYMFSRQKKGYSQPLVQSLLILPVVVTGIVILVQNSLALAFGLGAIVAAVRFRTNIEDSKDAAFIFLAMAVGLACGVELPVAATLSVLFNVVVMVLWYNDFGRAPANLEGEMAKRRLDRALAIANRTGAFVARMDEEVLKALAPEQLEALASRAQRRKAKLTGEKTTTAENAADAPQVLHVHTRDPDAARPVVEPLLNDYLTDWRFLRAVPSGEGVYRLEYLGRLAANIIPAQVLYDVRTKSTPHVMRCELKPRGPGDDA